MKTKFNYSGARWSISLTAFIAAGAPHIACATPSAIPTRHQNRAFVDTETFDSEDLYQEQDWQEPLMESETMDFPALASSSAPEVFASRIVSDEVAPFVFHPDEGDFISDFFDPDSLLLSEPLGEYDVVLHLEMDDEDDLVPLDMDSTDLEIFNV